MVLFSLYVLSKWISCPALICVLPHTSWGWPWRKYLMCSLNLVFIYIRSAPYTLYRARLGWNTHRCVFRPRLFLASFKYLSSFAYEFYCFFVCSYNLALCWLRLLIYWLASFLRPYTDTNIYSKQPICCSKTVMEIETRSEMLAVLNNLTWPSTRKYFIAFCRR
jgi:hypothetical protein